MRSEYRCLASVAAAALGSILLASSVAAQERPLPMGRSIGAACTRSVTVPAPAGAPGPGAGPAREPGQGPPGAGPGAGPGAAVGQGPPPFESNLTPAEATKLVKVRDDVYGVLEALTEHVYDRAHFERVRAVDPLHLPAAERAARFIYLNKTCFNGLWRVNRAGRFNVPFGRYRNPSFNDPALLLRANRALRGVEILHAPFEIALQRTAPGDFVYLDPPYDPLSETASFTSYTPDCFGWEDQKRLAAACSALDRRGVRFLLSNSATPRIRELYRGFEQRMVSAPRHINCKGDSRGRVDELLVFNA